MISKRIENSFRVRMFKLFYKQLSDLPATERFVTTIVKASEEYLPITERNESMIRKWYYEYMAKKGRN